MTPSVTPALAEIPTAMNATWTLTDAPYSTREKRSRPKSSVPNGCASDGGAKRAVKSIASDAVH